MNIIILKGYLIKKLTNWMFIFIVVISTAIYLRFNLTDERGIIALGASFGVGFLLVFYFNRLEPKLIKFDKDSIEMTYFSDPPYGKGKKIYSKNSVEALVENDKIILSENRIIIANIRKKAVDAGDWESLENYFR